MIGLYTNIMNWKTFGRKQSWAEVLSQDMSRGTEKKCTQSQSEYQCPNRDSNRAPAKYKSQTLPLDQFVQSLLLLQSVSVT
jgi:hypothetical protein